MPFALIFVGLLLIVTGVKNTQAQFGAQVIGDFTGPGNFVWWLASLGAVGALGYVPELKKFSIAFMSLIVIAMLLAAQRSSSTGGFFGQLTSALKSGPVKPTSDTGMNGLPDIEPLKVPENQSSTAAENFNAAANVAKWFF